MDEDATWYDVDLGPGHIVLDKVPALHETGTAAPLFSAHVYCGHGRPSQQLLSSCYLLPRYYFFYKTVPHLLADIGNSKEKY